MDVHAIEMEFERRSTPTVGYIQMEGLLLRGFSDFLAGFCLGLGDRLREIYLLGHFEHHSMR